MGAVLWVALSGLWASLLLSYSAWWPGLRTFPQVPMWGEASSWILHDYFCALAMIGATAIVVWKRHSPKWVTWGLWSIVGVGVLYWMSDLTRLQPWIYQYVIVFTCVAMTLRTDNRATFDFVAVMLGGIYFWSGAHKINPGFPGTYEWLVSPFESDLFYPLMWGVPAVEILIGIFLIAPARVFGIPLRKIGATGAIAMHLVILVLIGPLVHNWNRVVWPWNLAMIALAWLVLKNQAPLHWARKVKAIAFLVFWVLPSLHLVDLWNGYLSFSLYSGAVPRGEIRWIKNDEFLLDFDDWAVPDIHVPTVPVLGVYRALFNQYCLKNPDRSRDIYMNVEEVDRWKWRFKHTKFFCG